MNIKNTQSIIESILFTSGDPVELERFSSVLELDKNEVKKIINLMIERYKEEKRGMIIIAVENGYQMCSCPENANYVSIALQKKKKPILSNAALEVLAIVAYKQPVTKAYIEQVRGVESSNVVNNLAEKGYIEEKGKLDAPGRPVVFGTSQEFLRVFGLKGIGSLPKIEGIETNDAISMEGMGEETLGELQNIVE